MGYTEVAARDLTDARQNQAVLDLASALVRGESAEELIAELGPAGEAEARACARSRQRLAAVTTPVHLDVVWAMYGETGRMSTRAEHPHGEDFVRVKAAQLDWLTADLPGVTWSVVAVDDGCSDEPSSAAAMANIVAGEGYPSDGHRSMTVLRLADVLADVRAGRHSLGPDFDRLTSTDDSRKGGSILAGLDAAARRGVPAEAPDARHVLCYTDADLSANLAQLGSLVTPIVGGEHIAALGQRYGMPGAVLVKADGPSVEPRSTGDKPDKLIVLFRHMVRALLVPQLAHVLDTQAGFKAFDAAAVRPVLPRMASFNETFDVELLIRLAQAHGAHSIAVEPIVFTEDFAATNFPSVDPGPRHLAMVHQVVDLYERLVEPVAPATGEARELLAFLHELDLDGYVRLIEGLRAEDPGDPTLFDRRRSVAQLRRLAAPNSHPAAPQS